MSYLQPEIEVTMDEKFQGATEQALKDINKTLEEVKDRLGTLGVAVSQLPCGERKVLINNMEERFKIYNGQNLFVWGVLALFVVMTFSAFSKASQVEEKVEVLRKDIITLEKVSYGYNEYIRGGVKK